MKVYKVKSISCAHQLSLPYESKCNSLHGHNYKIEVWVEGDVNEDGMVLDFAHISKILDGYDHKNLNDFLSPSTAENFASHIALALFDKCPEAKITVRVWETDTCYAEAEL
jgi:6-pyruvoyltetrahydropterin/6-carboxytetrahydropterin synthase